MKKTNRRIAFKTAAGLAALSPVAFGATPAQVEGPFYPTNRDVDLTLVTGRKQRVAGEHYVISGTVRDDQGRPLQNAIVELWQADSNGRYNHDADALTNQIDKDFQYWGRFKTGANGRYIFRTIKPKKYKVTNTWDRPPHIHFKIMKRGFNEVTTQMYFSDETNLNQLDRLLQGLTPDDGRKLIVDFIRATSMEINQLKAMFSGSPIPQSLFKDIDPGLKVGVFDLELSEV